MEARTFTPRAGSTPLDHAAKGEHLPHKCSNPKPDMADMTQSTSDRNVRLPRSAGGLLFAPKSPLTWEREAPRTHHRLRYFANSTSASPAQLPGLPPPQGPVFTTHLLAKPWTRQAQNTSNTPTQPATSVGYIDHKYTWPGSSWQPSACEADVIATRPQVL